jgi:hypothetical protein
MSDSSLLPFVLYRGHVLFMLAVFIYAYWCASTISISHDVVSFNNNTTGVTSGAETDNLSGPTEFSIAY